MRKMVAILLGAIAFQLTTDAAETRSSEIGDAVRLLLFACAFLFFVAALPGGRSNSRRSNHTLDERFSGFDRRVVTLTLRGTEKPGAG